MYRLLSTDAFEKQFKQLDHSVQVIIKRWIEKNLTDCEDPRIHGKALKGNLGDYWRYRIGDYRLLAEIDDKNLVIIAISIGHRSKVYSR